MFKLMFIDCCLQCSFSTLYFNCLTLYAQNCILSKPMLFYQVLVVTPGVALYMVPKFTQHIISMFTYTYLYIWTGQNKYWNIEKKHSITEECQQPMELSNWVYDLCETEMTEFYYGFYKILHILFYYTHDLSLSWLRA